MIDSVKPNLTDYYDVKEGKNGIPSLKKCPCLAVVVVHKTLSNEVKKYIFS